MSSPRAYTKFDFGPAQGTAERRANLIAGGTVSRREYQRLIGAPLPKRDIHGERIDRKPVSLYTKVARKWAAEHHMSRRAARSDPKLSSNWRILRRLWDREARGKVVDRTPVHNVPIYEDRQGRIERTPDSSMADALRELGMKTDNQWYVGDTP